MSDSLPELYRDLAEWYPLLTAPEEYAEEAAFYQRLFAEVLGAPPRTLLELGCGQGAMASHFDRDLSATLVDLAPAMLALSRRLNPTREHVVGDMRTVRLGRTFDAVFLHDAVSYLTTEADLRAATATALVHCRPGGVALLIPNAVRETFVEHTSQGGHDGGGRSLRYLCWTWDPDPSDTTFVDDYAYLLRDDARPVRCIHDRHVLGLFPRADWLRLLTEVGFRPSIRSLEHSEVPPGSLDVFVARRPA
jgi:SAM-dependent methyltransferase